MYAADILFIKESSKSVQKQLVAQVNDDRVVLLRLRIKK